MVKNKPTENFDTKLESCKQGLQYKLQAEITCCNIRVQKTAYKTLSQILLANTVNNVVSN